jgi:hypothetical protein
MILISHRGNVNGPDKEKENTKSYIQSALDMGYHVEIDIWSHDGILFLGHDTPDYEVELEWLLERREKLLVHAKNFEALSSLTFNHLDAQSQLATFFHENEKYTIINNGRNIHGVVVNGLIWAHDIENISSKCIIPLIDKSDLDKKPKKQIWGICSDYVELLADGQ